jgi:hypothetical protein
MRSLLLLFIMLKLPFALAADVCGKVVKASGDTCPALKVQVDVSKCPDVTGPNLVDAKVYCGKDGNALARVWVPTAILKFGFSKPSFFDKEWKQISASTQGRNLANRDIASPAPAAPTPTHEEAREPQAQPEKAHTEPANTKTEQKPELAPAAKPAEQVNAVATLAEPTLSTSAPKAATFSDKFAGYLDFYYAYNTARPSQKNVITDQSNSVKTYANPTNKYRYYDFYHNQLSLSWAQLRVTHTEGDVSVQIDFDYGTAADQNALAGYSDSEPASASATDLVSKNIGQAFLTYKPMEVPGFSVSAGKMYTHIGYELPRPKDNWNYSHSVMYGYGAPFWHTGVAIGYEFIPEKLIATGYVYNGWNNFYDNNAAKSYGAQVKWVPSSEFTLVYNMIRGPEKWLNENDNKEVHEFNAQWNMSEAWSVAVEGLWGYEDRVRVPEGNRPRRGEWWATLLFVKHQPVSWYYTALRFENFTDEIGWIFAADPDPNKQVLQGYTLTSSATLAKGFDVRFEARHDVANRESKYLTAAGTTRTQTTFNVAGLYSF